MIEIAILPRTFVYSCCSCYQYWFKYIIISILKCVSSMLYVIPYNYHLEINLALHPLGHLAHHINASLVTFEVFFIIYSLIHPTIQHINVAYWDLALEIHNTKCGQILLIISLGNSKTQTVFGSDLASTLVRSQSTIIR